MNAWYPFGRVQTNSPQASFKVSRQFTGQIKDDETGLYYYSVRYYDPELGRFIQPDDIISDLGNPQSYNRYSYVLNNPLKYTDPDGHWPFDQLRAQWRLDAAAARMGALHGKDWTSYDEAARELKIGQYRSGVEAAGNVGIISAVGAATADAADIYINGGQELATAGMASGVIFTRKVSQLVARAASEEAGALTSSGLKWFPYKKHVPQPNLSWAQIIKSTAGDGAARYMPGIVIEKLERAVFESGVLSTRGKPWKYAEFKETIGASGGKPSRWVRVEESSGFIHGHPVTQEEFLKHTKEPK